MIYKKILNRAWIVSIAWILVTMATGLIAGVESLSGWLVVSLFALGPATVLMHFAKESPRTISQAIHEARR